MLSALSEAGCTCSVPGKDQPKKEPSDPPPPLQSVAGGEVFTQTLCVSVQILKTLVVAILVAGVVPLLLGLLFELVIVAPLRVPLDQTPLFYPWQVGVRP